MDYDPNPAAYIPPPIEQPHYYAPPTAHQPLKSPPPHYNAPHRSHIPRIPSLSHYNTPLEYAIATSSTLLPEYSAPPPLENPPPIHPPHYVAPEAEAYYGDRSMAQDWVSSRSYVFSTVYNANPSSHHSHSHGYEPYSDPFVTTHSTHHQGSAPSVSRYSYQSTAYQSGGYDRFEYPQVSSRVRMQYPQYPQYPPAKSGLVPQRRVPYPKQKKPKPIKPDHYCQICKVRCCTAKDLGYHIQGKKHQSNMEMLQEEGITPTIGPQLEGATDLTKSPSQLAERKRKKMPSGAQPEGATDLPKNPSQLAERKRKKMPLGAQPEGATDLPKSPSQLAERKRKKMPLGPASKEELEVKKKRVFDGGAPVEGVRVCGVCNIVVNSQKVFDSHCAGSKHAMMLKKLQEGS